MSSEGANRMFKSKRLRNIIVGILIALLIAVILGALTVNSL